MKARPRYPRKPPSSSYSHSPETSTAINVSEIARRMGSEERECPPAYPHPQTPMYISCLPPEIMAEIFAFCLPSETFPIPSRSEAPLLLTQVSSYWRTLAISTPELWTALHINYKDPVEDIPACNNWLSRSINRPVSLSIAIDFGEKPQQEILDAICKHSRRWKHVRFDFRHLLCPPMYSLDSALDNVPQLSTFEFHARDISNTNVYPITRLLASAPQLRQVSWVDDLADTKTIMELPLGQLSHLSLAMEHGHLDYLQVLNECLNLEHVKITKPLFRAIHPQQSLCLPKLTSLNIASDLTGIFDHLTLPSLREVRIHTDLDKHAQSHAHLSSSLPHVHPSLSTELWNPATFCALIERSACSITSLSITSPMAEDALMECLRRSSHSLQKLSVEGTGVGDVLLKSLTHPSNRKEQHLMAYDTRVDIDSIESLEGNRLAVDVEALCPRLEEIAFDTRVRSTQDVLANMVESRLNLAEGWTPLRRIRIAEGQKDVERLKEFRRTGRIDPSTTFSLDIIPRKKPRINTRNYFFRRKLCASR
ncbi:hypothetical protein CPC08DRAFT_815515 [Agrocybe pediades]|nr:hypothetical protein CPC08DRAFT_815515 [Agrocybe pediades]